MSFEDGWAAINLEMPRRIPHTEYSLDYHWDLIKAVTGIVVGVESPPDVRRKAARALMQQWNYDFLWSTLIGHDEFGGYATDMGHAEYMVAGEDRREAVASPFEGPEDVLNFDPWEVLSAKNQTELTRRFEAHYQANCADAPFCVNMTGIYITLISGFIGLFGWENLLLAAGSDLVRFGALANRYASWMQQYFDALAEADVPVVMVHDDIVWAAGAIFRPAWYREYIFPNYRKYFSPLLESGKKVIFCSDGNFDEFIDDIAQTGVHGFVFEPLTSLEYIVEKYGRTHVIIGNADTRFLLYGSKEDIRREVERCLMLGRGCPGYFLAVGNHIPPNTPVENILYYYQLYTELGWR